MIPIAAAAGADHSEFEGTVKTAPATALHFVSDGTGGYRLSATGRPAAALLADGAGGYVLTAGATAGDAMVARVGENVIIR